MTTIALHLLGAVVASPSAFSGTIVDIQRVETFMGKRGYRVTEMLIVKSESKSVEVRLFPYHTNVANTKRFVIGDNVIIPNHNKCGKFALSEIRYAK